MEIKIYTHMNPKPYHLQIPAKTHFFNLFRRFFILSGLDKVLPVFTRHRSLNTLPGKLIPPNYLYTRGSIRNTKIDGINLKLDISDTVDHSNYFAFAEPAQIVLFNAVTPGMTILDIGANIGATTLNFAKKTGQHGKVFSFEPSPYNFKKAMENISLNSLENINLINKGLGNEKKSAFLYNVNTTNNGMQRLLQQEPQKDSYEKTTVEIDTLDNCMSELDIPSPSLIKIDVEGFEYNVLLGARETLLRHKPTMFIELDDNNLREQGSTAENLVKFLTGLNYKLINASDGSFVDERTDFQNCHFDIMCTPAVHN
ncbi:MAG: FkbM family methyltransferase [Ginsengibacter sp.]